MDDETVPPKPKLKREQAVRGAGGFVIGMLLGIGIGDILQNLAAGIAVGIALGVALGNSFSERSEN